VHVAKKNVSFADDKRAFRTECQITSSPTASQTAEYDKLAYQPGQQSERSRGDWMCI